MMPPRKPMTPLANGTSTIVTTRPPKMEPTIPATVPTPNKITSDIPHAEKYPLLPRTRAKMSFTWNIEPKSSFIA